MHKQILKLAVPFIVTNITVPLLGMVDMALMGHLDDEKYIGAIALGSTIFNFIYWALAFLRMGTSGFTAQAFGAKNHKESILILSRALLVAFASSTILIVLQSPIVSISFYFIEGPIEVESLATAYFNIRVWAAPASIGLFAVYGWLLGMQNAKSPMYISILINILNIGFNVVFVNFLGMKSEGVAIGTVLAQYSGFTLGLIIILKKYKYLFTHWNWHQMVKFSALKEFFKVNSDIFIRTVCIIIVFTFFNTKSATFGKTILAVNMLLLQFLMFYSYLIDGFANAAEALVGKYLGAGNQTKFNQFIKNIFLWAIGISLPFTLIYFFLGEQFLLLLTSNTEVLKTSEEYLFWVFLIPILSFWSFVWDGIYIGATSSRFMLITMLLATFLVFFPLFYFLHPIIGNHGLWLAMISFMFSRGLFQTITARRAVLKKISTEQ